MEAENSNSLYNIPCKTCKVKSPIDKNDIVFVKCKNGRHLIKTKCTVCLKQLNVLVSKDTYEKISKDIEDARVLVEV